MTRSSSERARTDFRPRSRSRAKDVLVVEASPVAGRGLRSDELTLPGYRHDVCSAIHPLAVASPFLSTLPLQEHGLEWIEPPLPCAHPLDGRPAALLARDPGVTASRLGTNGSAWLALVKPFLARWPGLLPELAGAPPSTSTPVGDGPLRKPGPPPRNRPWQGASATRTPARCGECSRPTPSSPWSDRPRRPSRWRWPGMRAGGPSCAAGRRVSPTRSPST